MAKTSDHVWQRGRQWYLKLAIPRKVRRYFPSSTGKPRSKIVEPLADSYEVAKVQAAQKVGRYLGVFARLKAGETMTPEQIAAATNIDLDFNPRTASVLRSVGQWLGDESFLAFLREKAIADGMPLEQLDRITAFRQVPLEPAKGETISQAAEVWLAELAKGDRRADTVQGHRQRVRVFTELCGDVALSAVTRAVASDVLDKIAAEKGISNGTLNSYALSLELLFEHAARRGRFTGDNPFEDQRREVVREKRQKFTVEELQQLFDSFPREVKPAKHSTATAVGWATLISAYSGLRLEEICQLSVADIRTLPANGSTVDCFLIHNGGDNSLKNESSERAVPVHSVLARALKDYLSHLPKSGRIFPGLKRDKDGKLGTNVGAMFNKRLNKLGIKRGRLIDFHSLRHTAITAMQTAGKSKDEVAAVAGHYEEGITFRVYGVEESEIMAKGHRVLKTRAATVEAIAYEGLKLSEEVARVRRIK